MSNIMLEKWNEFVNSSDFPVETDDTFIPMDACEEPFYAGWNMAEENQESIGAHDFMREQEQENQFLKEQVEMYKELLDIIMQFAGHSKSSRKGIYESFMVPHEYVDLFLNDEKLKTMRGEK